MKVANPYCNLDLYLAHGDFCQCRAGHYGLEGRTEEGVMSTLFDLMTRILTSDEHVFVAMVFGLENGIPCSLGRAAKAVGWNLAPSTVTHRLERIRRRLLNCRDDFKSLDQEVAESREPIEGLSVVPMSDYMRERPIEQLGLPARVTNELRHVARIIGTLCTQTEDDLMHHRGLGEVGVEQVKKALKAFDPTLRLATLVSRDPAELELHSVEIQERVAYLAGRRKVSLRKLWRTVSYGAKILGVPKRAVLTAIEEVEGVEWRPEDDHP